jgi:hypothetical protein
VVEAGGDDAGGDAARQFAPGFEDGRPGVEHAGDDLELVCAALGRVAGGLELDRRLAFVGDPQAHAADGTHGVEQPADGGRDGGGQAGLREPSDRAPALGVDARQRPLVAGRLQPRAGHPPWLAHGLVAARQRDRPQVAGALEAAQVADQDLAAPHRPVGAEPTAVEDRADRRPLLAVVGQAGREVGVVVLDRDALDALARERVCGRGVVGLQVVRHHLGGDREQPLQVPHALLVRRERLGGSEVADVVGDPGAPPAREAERAPVLGAAGQHLAAGRQRQCEHARHGAARTAQRQRPAACHAQHRVIDAGLDRPVMLQDQVGDLLTGAGHYQRLADVLQQQVVERVAGEHHAELG